jgi:two component regulator with propeller domain
MEVVEMKKKKIKIVILSMLPLMMIVTLYYYNALQKTFYEGRNQYLEGTNPGPVRIDSSGQAWIQDEGGIWRTFEEDTLTQRPYPGAERSQAFDHEGNLWIVAYSSGLYRMDGKNKTSFTTANSGLASKYVSHLAVDNLDRLWITYSYGGGLSASGVTVFDGSIWTTFTTSNSGLTSNEVSAVTFDSENRAWIGTTQGINVFDGKEWVDYSFEEIGFRNSYSFLGPQILIDHSGRIWIQNDGDMRIFDGTQWIGLAEEDGYNSNVGSIATDKQANILIENGNDRGLVVLNPEYPLTSAWRTQPARVFLSSGGIWYIAFILVCLFVAILLDSIATVALPLLGGVSTFAGWAAIFNDPHVVYFLLLVNPGIYATVGGMIGASAGILSAARAGTPRGLRPVVIGFVLGLVIGICQIMPALLAQ